MEQDQVGGVSGSSDAFVAVASTTDYEYARQLVLAYFAMLTTGCQRDECSNDNCCSNPQTPALSASEAAIKSIYFATQYPVPLCIDFDELQQKGLPDIPEQPLAEENQTNDMVPTEEDHKIKEELHPETPEETPKPQQPETIMIQTPPPTSTSERKSTPRQRLSIAVELDHGLNKSREPTKRPTVVTRVVVQPKHKLVIAPVTSVRSDVIATKAATETTATEQRQEHEQVPVKVPSPVKDMRQRRLSRPKEKLFDAIKRSFSRSKKAPLGSGQ